MRSYSTTSTYRADSWGGAITFFCRYAEWTLWILGIAAAVATFFSGDVLWIVLAYVLDVLLLPLLRALRVADVVWREYPYSPSYQKQKLVSRRTNAAFFGSVAILGLAGVFVANPAVLCLFGIAFYILTSFASLMIDDFIERITRNIRMSLSADVVRQPCANAETLARKASLTGEESFEETGDFETSKNELASCCRERFEHGERIYGRRLVEFAEGETTIILHLAFCPPFDGVPSFDFDIPGGEDVEVKATSVQTFGARLEISRNRPNMDKQTSNVEIWIDYFAEYASEKRC